MAVGAPKASSVVSQVRLRVPEQTIDTVETVDARIERIKFDWWAERH
jgi:hypothetical protein